MNNQLKECHFHPFEFSLCGFSGSGKTTLLEKLIKSLSQDYQLGVVKHDAHYFEMDYQGKDTFRFREAGAQDVFIGNQERYAFQGHGNINSFELKQRLLKNDFILVEGHKHLKIAKIVMVDYDYHILKEDLENIYAYAFINQEHLEQCPYKISKPTFIRDNIDTIKDFILSYFKEKIPPIKALILAGGKSSRMGQDKFTLNYHGKDQVSYLYELLKEEIDEVYISLRAEQKDHPLLKELPTIEDQYQNLGPTAGILSSFDYDPSACWLVLAIDLPFINKASLKELIEQRNPFKMATSFINPEKKWPEPLCTLWEPKSRPQLHWFVGIGRSCPRKVLFNSPIKSFYPSNKRTMENCNTPDDYSVTKEILTKDFIS